MDPAFVLEQIELQIGKVKEEAFSRKEILEKVEKWLGACDEESWLEEYNRVKCFYISLFMIYFFLSTSLCLIVMLWWFRMRTDTMLEEVLILRSSELRKLVLWLINFQVYCIMLVCSRIVYRIP